EHLLELFAPEPLTGVAERLGDQPDHVLDVARRAAREASALSSLRGGGGLGGAGRGLRRTAGTALGRCCSAAGEDLFQRGGADGGEDTLSKGVGENLDAA